MRGRYGVSPLEGVAEDAVVESGETTVAGARGRRPFYMRCKIKPLKKRGFILLKVCVANLLFNCCSSLYYGTA